LGKDAGQRGLTTPTGTDHHHLDGTLRCSIAHVECSVEYQAGLIGDIEPFEQQWWFGHLFGYGQILSLQMDKQFTQVGGFQDFMYLFAKY
jgi:hypothetical protein